jgi:hypothetical protein
VQAADDDRDPMLARELDAAWRSSFRFTMLTAGLPPPALSETGALPSGIIFTDNGNGTATIGGTAAQGTAGAYPTTIGATNGVLPNATQSFTLTVVNASEQYDLVGSDGGVFVFGISAGFYGSLPGLGVHVNDIVGIVPTSDDKGYFLVGSDGGTFAFGDAAFEGSLPGLGVHVNDIVGIALNGRNGYWLVGADGAVYALGGAGYFGGLGGTSTTPIVGMAATQSGNGYWLVGRTGSVLAYGDATSYGSLPALGVSINNVVALVPTPDQLGYWIIGSDGGVFAFGDAQEIGSLPGLGSTWTTSWVRCQRRSRLVTGNDPWLRRRVACLRLGVRNTFALTRGPGSSTTLASGWAYTASGDQCQLGSNRERWGVSAPLSQLLRLKRPGFDGDSAALDYAAELASSKRR